MHAIHHTKAVIIKSLASKEADKLYWLYTQDFGLVVAVATGVRKPGAKLAGQLIDYSFVEADLVKGRDVWRLVSAVPLATPLLGNTTHPLARAYVRMLATLERFVVDEGVHPELFEELEAAAALLHTEYADSRKFDTLVIWRILTTLGYISSELLEQHLYSLPIRDALLQLDDAHTNKLIAQVNIAIKETHL